MHIRLVVALARDSPQDTMYSLEGISEKQSVVSESSVETEYRSMVFAT